MEIKLTYQEISNIIEKYVGYSLSLSYLGSQTVHVRYKIIGIDLTIEGIEESNIDIEYNGTVGIPLIVRGAILMFKNRPIGKLIEPLDDNRVRLCLRENEKVRAIFDQVNIESIRFDEQFAFVNVSVKVEK